MQSYVYAHILPDTGNIIYIGMGSGPRAFDEYKRSGPHLKVLTNLMRLGYTPSDFAVIVAQGLTPQQARRVEARIIKAIRPPMNQQMNGAANGGRGTANHNAVLTPDLVRFIRKKHAAAMPLRAIARELGVAYTTVRKVAKGIAWAHIPTTTPGVLT